MSVEFCSERIKEIFEERNDRLTNPSIILAEICDEFHLRPRCIQHCGIPFCERTFFRYLSSNRKGDGDGEAVFIYFY
jgi:hypothetical protein